MIFVGIQSKATVLFFCFQAKFEGTRVTIESFLAWKAKFDAEMDELKRRKGEQEKANDKLTGR